MNNVIGYMIEVQNIPRANTAIAEWVAVIIFMGLIKPRLSKWKTIAIAIGSLFVQVFFMEVTQNVSIVFWLPCMFIAFALMVGQIYLLYNVSFDGSIYLGVQAFVIAEFAASLEWQLTCFFARDYAKYMVWLWILILAAVYALVYLGLHFAFIKHIPRDNKMYFTKKELISEIIMGILFFAMSNIGFWQIDTPFSNGEVVSMFNLRTFVDFSGVVILYAHLIVCGETRMRTELDKVHDILENQYQQYKISRDSIELVNIKYHDLKHQIAILKSEENPEKRRAFLEKMEQEIKQYELQNKTGNKVLDTILTSKSIYCDKHGITLTCVADGMLLEQIDVMDICTIFGNALDNAIECEMKISDKEKRLIHLTVSKQRDFLLIGVENYCEEEINVDKGTFISSKADRENHGYGIKSIRYSAEKYGGAVSIKCENKWFDLKILIPMRKE